MKTMTIARLPVLALALAATACGSGGLGGLGEILTGGGAGGQGQTGSLTVEIQDVREQDQQILVLTQEGQRGPVLYDQNTQVIYRNEQYPVRALERGDIVDMRIQEIQQGYYTDLIEVRQSVQERQGGTTGSSDPNLYRLEGTIGTIDVGESMFTLDMTQGGTLPVYLPDNATAAERDRLRDYRSGDYVRVEVRPLSEETAELVRWGWSS
jgi:hypothetical protein